MLKELQELKNSLDTKGYATRKDIQSALDIIKTKKGKTNQELFELTASIYKGKDQEKLLADIDSYRE